MNNMPNLFIPGAAKSATSSLHDYLNQHPDINMSEIKEPHFFCAERYDEERISYQSMFDNSIRVNGESSTGYMVFDGVVERIKKYCSDPKFIFILRNPVDRYISHYKWMYGHGYESRSILDAFYHDRSIEPKYKERVYGIGYKSYFQWGLYHRYIAKFFTNFPAKNILIITTEELRDSPQETLNRCVTFLGLRKFDFSTDKQTNVSVNRKHKWLYRFLSGYDDDSLVKKFYRRLPCGISNHIMLYKKSIMRFLNKSNACNVDAVKMTVTDSERKEIAEAYADDVRNLKRLTSMDFQQWHDFK